MELIAGGISRRDSNIFDPDIQDRPWRELLKVSATSAVGWYFFRLALRDNFLRGVKLRRQVLIEANSLHVLHSAMWLGIILDKLRKGSMVNSSGLRRPLVASLGFLLHDAFTLWPIALQEPLMLLHQLSTFFGLASVARSENMNVVPTVMTTEIPTLFSALMRLLAATGGPPVVLRLARILWVSSFFITKALVLPSFLVSHRHDPELHQPTMRTAKVAYAVRVVINVCFLASAAQDFPRFLARGNNSAARDPFIARALWRASSTLIGGSLFAAFMSLYFVGPVAIPLIIQAFIRGSRPQKGIAAAIGLLLTADVLLPHPKHANPFMVKLNAFLAKPLLAYFQFKAIHSNPCELAKSDCSETAHHEQSIPAEHAFRKDGRYLVAVYPHGFIPVGLTLLMARLNEAGFMPSVLGASVISKLPVLGRFAALGGFVPATSNNTELCLQRAYPENITFIVPGGTAEMFKVRPDCEVILAERRGFVRMAVESGADLVPVYSFGNTRAYQVAIGAVAAAFERISRVLRTSFVPFTGVGGTLVPFAHPQAIAVGKPIKTAGRDVEDVAQEFFTELRRLYQEHRDLVGWKRRELYFDGEQPPMPETLTEQTAGGLLFPPLAKL